MTEQLTLFNLAPDQVIKTVHDPYWDEIVLSTGGVEETGQLTLLYDDTTEPPDPDDYPSREAYNQAWDEWEKRNPQLVPEVRAMSDDEGDRTPPPIKENRKIKHRHIPGGNVKSLIAQRRKASVEIAIAAGKSPNEIEKIIRI